MRRVRIRIGATLKKQFSGAFAVSVSDFSSHANITIGSNASLTSNLSDEQSGEGAINVEAKTFLPYEFVLERFVGLGVAVNGLLDFAMAGYGSTSWAGALARDSADRGAAGGDGEGSKGFGGSASVNVLSISPNARVAVADGAVFNTTTTVDGKARGDVSVTADVKSELVSLVDDPFGLKDVATGLLGKGPETSSGGGSLAIMNYTGCG